ncbi:MAG: hypothetical protein ACK5X3_05865 [Pseudomonadota bacterium]
MAGNANIGSLYVDLGIDTAAFSDGLKKASAGAAGFGAKFAAIGKTVALAGAAMAASAGAAFVTFGAQALTAADDIGDAAARIGISAEAFQKLGAAASAAGGTPELMTAALDKLNVGLGAFVQTGGGPAAQAFKDMGLASKIASGEIQTADQAFYAAAKAMEGIESPAEKARISMQLFGRAAGADMLEVLAAGEQGLKQYGEAAANSGRIMSTEMTDRLSGLKLQLENTKLALTQMAMVFAGRAIMATEDFAKSLRPAFDMAAKFLTPAIDELKASLTKLSQNEGLMAALRILGTMFKGLATLLGGAVLGTIRVVITGFAKMFDVIDLVYKAITPMVRAIEQGMNRVIAVFKPATDALNVFTNTAKKMENDVTKNSYVPDMVDAIVLHMQRSDKAFNDSAQVMQRYVENAKQMAADVRAFDLMSQAERASGAISRADARAARPDFLGNVGALNVKDSPLASTDWIDKWKDGQTKAINDNDELRSAFANTFSEGLSEALNGNGGNWMKSWWQKTMQNAFQNAANNAGRILFDLLNRSGGSSGSGGGGIGDWVKVIASFFTKSPGFATGGSFKVGGSGGPDSKYIGMRLTPGEMVNVSKPGNDNGGGQIVIPVSLGGEHIETIMVDIATRQATVVTSAAFQGVATSQERAKTYSRYGR